MNKKIWRIIDLLQWGEKYFREKGVEQPRLEIEYLLSHVLGKKRLSIYLEFEKIVPQDELTRLRQVIERRVSGEPLMQLLGETDFYGCRIKVSRDVLIPRSETELMIDEAVRELKKTPPSSIVDLGCGSGCIAIAMAGAFKDVPVKAVDVSKAALEVAKENALLNHVSDSIEWIEEDMISFLSHAGKLECVISNPPYISLEEFNTLSPSVKDFEPRKALTDEGDGTFYLKAIMDSLSSVLIPEGVAFMEFGCTMGMWVEGYAKTKGLKPELYRDLAGHIRFVKLRLQK